jgi:hypothetical protein
VGGGIKMAEKYSIVLEGRIPMDLPEFNFISKCSEKMYLITP